MLNQALFNQSFTGISSSQSLFYRWTRSDSLVSRLLGRTRTLASLDRPLIGNGRDGGLRTVEICKIIGSEGRTRDFDRGFHPLQDRTRERWLRVLNAFEQGLPLPPVELVRVGGAYYVRDGHHRISVAAALGQRAIEAHVTEWNE